MGNDHSQIKGLEIEQKAVEITDFWTLYGGELTNGDRYTIISIFKDAGIVNGQLWAAQSPLERFTKNLMIHRHPSILKFITSWERGSHKFLATERCKPLIPDFSGQSDVQVCLGLRSILCALIFLVEQANARHLNVCAASVYVNQDGTWKLAGFEHLWKAKDVTMALVERCQGYRYKKAIDPNELKAMSTAGIEQYAFAVFCSEILKNLKDTKMPPHTNEFKSYCATHLKHATIAMRPKLSAILLHPFFNHEFVLIHSFLTELPLKSQQEKQQFFTGLVDRLREFDEENVAKQLIGFLLSRMVLLDPTAQLCVTPFVLRPRIDDNCAPIALFAPATFTKHIVPRLMNIFYVRDAQIRLILLEYFNHYVRFIGVDDLQEQLLPQLLVGIKDTNDHLVAATLRCLADLVPILGSAIVIGRNRGRIFADGRPHGLPNTAANWAEHRSITPVMNNAAAEYIAASGSPMQLDHVDVSESYASPNSKRRMMPERPSPDGGEDVTSSGVLEFEDDSWSDWEADNNVDHNDAMAAVCDGDDAMRKSGPGGSENASVSSLPSMIPNGEVKSFIKDVKEMDNKAATARKSAEVEFDFFKDMEPVIQKTNVLVIGDVAIDLDRSEHMPTNETADSSKTEKEKAVVSPAVITIDNSRFEIKTTDGDGDAVDEMGWDDETNGWDEND